MAGPLLPIALSPDVETIIEVNTQDATQLPEFSSCPWKRLRLSPPIPDTLPDEYEETQRHVDVERSAMQEECHASSCSNHHTEDSWLAGLIGEEQARAEVSKGALKFPEVLPKAQQDAPASSGESQHDSYSDGLPDIVSLPLGMCVKYWVEECSDLGPSMSWNFKQDPKTVLQRVLDVGNFLSSAFYCGITSSPRNRFIGNFTFNGNWISGHMINYDKMEFLFHTNKRCAILLERWIIRQVLLQELPLDNRSKGGEASGANTPNWFFYVAFSELNVKLPKGWEHSTDSAGEA